MSEENSGSTFSQVRSIPAGLTPISKPGNNQSALNPTMPPSSPSYARHSNNNSANNSPRFFDPNVSLTSIPPFLLSTYETSRKELAEYDGLMRKKAREIASKLENIDVVLGIPFYTEITNIISVLVTLKEVFQQRKQRACILVIGEFGRSDMVESIPLHQLQDTAEDDDTRTPYTYTDSRGQIHTTTSYANIETFWKPHHKYASKPFTVRALQVVANTANGGDGAHLIIMDADIQFNHWELSAMSLMRALLDPLMRLKAKEIPLLTSPRPISNSAEQQPIVTPDFHPQFPLSDLDSPPAASFVLLNAPRSFIADDALIHLFSYLMTYSYLGQRIHQAHGGEFSIHKTLNRQLLSDESLVYRGCYCVEAQMVCRALLETQPTHSNNTESIEYGGYVLEMLMKGKWHAKITLGKLLQLDDKGGARIDLVTEKIFNDAILFSSLGIYSSVGQVHIRTGGLTKTPNPDPNQQSMKVLAPIATKKEIMVSIKQYYMTLLQAQSDGSLPIDSLIVQELIPMLHSKIAKLPGESGWKLIKAFNRTVSSKHHNLNHSHSPRYSDNVDEDEPKPSDILFGAEEWSRYTMECLRIYQHHSLGSKENEKEKQKELKQRTAVIAANRVVWLLGALAFLNEHSSSSWGQMHQCMTNEYAPVFRRRYLMEMMNMTADEAGRVVDEEYKKVQQ